MFMWLGGDGVYHEGEVQSRTVFSLISDTFAPLQIGLLPRGNDQLVATGWKIYANRVKEDERGAAACSFRTSFSKLVRFEFLGLW
jgi:uncharacterized protein (DUF2235 family)